MRWAWELVKVVGGWARRRAPVTDAVALPDGLAVGDAVGLGDDDGLALAEALAHRRR